jgi:hypothetical protein
MGKIKFNDLCRAIVFKWTQNGETLEDVITKSTRGFSSNFEMVVRVRCIEIANQFDTREDIRDFENEFKGGLINDYA